MGDTTTTPLPASARRRRERRAVRRFLATRDVAAVADAYGCTPATLYRWVRRHATDGYARRHARLLQKHDVNGDGFVSMREYLDSCAASAPSQGPDADPGDIRYHYQNMWNVYAYNYLFVSQARLREHVAIPDDVFVVRGTAVRGACAVDVHRKELVFPDRLLAAVRRARSRCRFVMFSLVIFPDEAPLSHVNACVVDTRLRTLERFEPYGCIHPQAQATIDSIFQRFVLPACGIPSFRYLRPLELSPAQGIQSRGDAFDGMCVSITSMYFQIRLLNPDADPAVVVTRLARMDPTDLRALVSRFARMVEDRLKAHGGKVRRLNRALSTVARQQTAATIPTMTIQDFEARYMRPGTS